MEQEIYRRSMQTILNLKKCPESVLDNLPKNMEVRGNLDIQETKIESLPEGLKVGGGLNLFRCKYPQSLPENLKVGGRLNLEYCIFLESLPEGLKVGGDLDIWGCQSLKSIPKGLKVGWGILINWRTGVRKEDFPERLWNQIKERKE